MKFSYSTAICQVWNAYITILPYNIHFRADTGRGIGPRTCKQFVSFISTSQLQFLDGAYLDVKLVIAILSCTKICYNVLFLPMHKNMIMYI